MAIITVKYQTCFLGGREVGGEARKIVIRTRGIFFILWLRLVYALAGSYEIYINFCHRVDGFRRVREYFQPDTTGLSTEAQLLGRLGS